MVAELDGMATGKTVKKSFLWGLDASGTMQGAGGVGGLLKMDQPNAYPFISNVGYDHNFNVVTLFYDTMDEGEAQMTGTYEYNAFGETIRAAGDHQATNPFRFSTKYTDVETGLVYYGRRFYSPSLGRFIGRDPIEEKGGRNLYNFVSNDPVHKWDMLGDLGNPRTPADWADPSMDDMYTHNPILKDDKSYNERDTRADKPKGNTNPSTTDPTKPVPGPSDSEKQTNPGTTDPEANRVAPEVEQFKTLDEALTEANSRLANLDLKGNLNERGIRITKEFVPGEKPGENKAIYRLGAIEMGKTSTDMGTDFTKSLRDPNIVAFSHLHTGGNQTQGAIVSNGDYINAIRYGVTVSATNHIYCQSGSSAGYRGGHGEVFTPKENKNDSNYNEKDSVRDDILIKWVEKIENDKNELGDRYPGNLPLFSFPKNDRWSQDDIKERTHQF